MSHKFSIKQMVTYLPAIAGGTNRNGRYEIVRLLPTERGVNQYRMKSVLDGHERVALETELS